MNSNTTLFGGRTITVRLEPTAPGAEPATETFTVRQFKLREYPALLPLLDDDIGLVSIAINKTREQTLAIMPDSFEELYKAMREANEKGFFTFAARRIEETTRMMAGLAPETIQAVMRASASSPQLQTTPPPPR